MKRSSFVEKFSSRCSGNRADRPLTSSSSCSRCVNDYRIVENSDVRKILLRPFVVVSSSFFHFLLSHFSFSCFFLFFTDRRGVFLLFRFLMRDKRRKFHEKEKDGGVWWGDGRGVKEEGQRERKERKREKEITSNSSRKLRETRVKIVSRFSKR